MKVTYIGHSGFLVELEACYCVFDYYQGELPEMNPEKPVLVFASHSHPDHYNPEIFKLLEQQKMQVELACLSKDIKEKKWPAGYQILSVKANQTYELSHDIILETLHSTDIGVAFILKTAEGNIYHAGDLNDWYWEGESKAFNNNMTTRYRREIDSIEDLEFAVAFVPLDPRQGKDYARGMLYFLDHVKAEKVYPMHFWERFDIINKFLDEYPKYEEIIQKIEG